MARAVNQIQVEAGNFMVHAIVWPWELPHGNEYEHIFLSACLVESFPISPERKHKIDFFSLFYTTRPFCINCSIGEFNEHPNHWQGKEQHCSFFNLKVLRLNKLYAVNIVISYNSYLFSFQTQFSLKWWKQCNRWQIFAAKSKESFPEPLTDPVL